MLSNILNRLEAYYKISIMHTEPPKDKERLANIIEGMFNEIRELRQEVDELKKSSHSRFEQDAYGR